MISHYKTLIAWYLAPHLDMPIDAIADLIEIPPMEIDADFAFPCFTLAKTMKMAPAALAERITAELRKGETSSCMFSAMWPYINIHITTGDVVEKFFRGYEHYGPTLGTCLPKTKKILLEWRQPNTHKAMHVGHLRNALVSESLSRIVEAAGYQLTRCSYMGDIGAHVAKWIRYYTRFDNSPIPETNASVRAGQIYVLATKKVEEDSDSYKAQIHETQRLLESGDVVLNALRQQTRTACLADMMAIYADMDCRIDQEYFESDVEQEGIALVKKFAEEKTCPYIYHSEWAIIANLEEFGLGVFVLLKTNGTSLYSTKDIALAYRKRRDFAFDESVYIVGAEQIHHFNQLFKTLELIGFGDTNMKHIAYEMVELSSGKMSSRDGTVVLYQELRDQVIAKADVIIRERGQMTDESVIASQAKAIAFASMHFGMLLQDSYKKIIFDMERATSFEGETGPYVQYSYARCCALLRKAKEIDLTTDASYSRDSHGLFLTETDEKDLLLYLMQYGDTIERSASEYRPHSVARYALDLCHRLNNYYQNHHIIDKDNLDRSRARLLLIQTARDVLGHAMQLVCVPIIESM